MNPNFVQWDLEEILPGEVLPAPLYLLLEGRYVRYRQEGQAVERITFDRMKMKQLRYFFIIDKDREKFRTWFKSAQREPTADPSSPPPAQPTAAVPAPSRGPSTSSERISQNRQETQRQVADIFHSFHTNEQLTQMLETSSRLVDEMTKMPATAHPLAELQTLSRGTAEHSVNVSILSVYLALNMGYTHMVVLRHVAAGALLHDIGKIAAMKVGEENVHEYEAKLREHPLLGEAMLSKSGSVSRETLMIVAQHHELHDGSGFPKNLRGNQIYDLTKIVTIANVFDSLVAEGKGPLAARQKEAVAQLEGAYASKFQPIKLKKAIKILKLGI